MAKSLQSLIEQTVRLLLCPRGTLVAARARPLVTQETHHFYTIYKFCLNAEVHCALAAFWIIQEDNGNSSKAMLFKITYQVAQRGQD